MYRIYKENSWFISGRFLNFLKKVVYFGKILDQFTAHFLESP